VLSEGYAAVRRLSDMALDDLSRLPPAALPPGLVIKPVLPEHLPAVYRAYKDAWAGLPAATPEGEADEREFVADNAEAPGADPSLWQVAWDGDEVAGFVVLRVRDGVGTVPEVAVRKRWQRRGVARALMVRGLEALRERGVAQVRLYTNAADEEGARSLYEGLGFREVKQHAFYRKPMGPAPR
jgi:ribosomal protein S18 acetylase RimI-like enzyme